MDDSHDVKLYVYDVSKGLASSLSPMLLGRQIEGVWHTAVVVYGEEFFYGGAGIQSCSPGGTVLGAPTEIVSLGKSELPYDIFLSYLEELSQNSFRGDRYHLFQHNCNTFSNELANFLTGRSIPAHITDLPQEVLQTPFGAMIKPFVDAMSVSPEGGHTLFDGGNMPPAAAAATSPQNVSAPASQAAKDEAMATEKPCKVPTPITYPCSSVTEDFTSQRLYLAGKLCPLDMQLVDEVSEFLTVKGIHDWSLGVAHLKALCRLIGDADIAVEARQLLSSLLQMALLSNDVISACVHDAKDSSFAGLLQDYERFSGNLLVAVAKCVCNCASMAPGAQWLISLKPHGSTMASTNSLIAVVSNSWLLTDDPSLRPVAAHIISNIVRSVQTLSAELALDLGIPLIEACKQPAAEYAEHLWFSLYTCMSSNSELVELVPAMGLEVSDTNKQPNVCEYVSKIKKIVSADR